MGVAWRIVPMRQVRLGRNVAFELNPVEALNILIRVGVDEGVQLAVRDVVKDPAIGANVLNRFRQLDTYFGIVLRSDDIPSHLACRNTGLASEQAASQDTEQQLFKQNRTSSHQSYLYWMCGEV